MRKMLKRTIIFTVLLITINCILPNNVLAQGPGFPDAPVDTPLDGGATLIAVAAAGYGLKKLRKNNKER